LLDFEHVDPGRSGEADQLAVGDHVVGAERAAQLVQRRAQARPRARLEDVGPEAGGQLEARVQAWMERQPGEQLACGPAGRDVERAVAGFDGELAEEADAQHGRTLRAAIGSPRVGCAACLPPAAWSRMAGWGGGGPSFVTPGKETRTTPPA